MEKAARLNERMRRGGLNSVEANILLELCEQFTNIIGILVRRAKSTSPPFRLDQIDSRLTDRLAALSGSLA